MTAITLELTEAEASALSVALVLLIHDKDSPDRWRIAASDIAARLPHQCDSWDIAGDDGHHSFATGRPHAEAVADLTAFIREAQDTLKALIALKALLERREVKP